MKTNKLLQDTLRRRKAIRIKFSVASYLTALMIVLAPISPVHAPSFDISQAQAVNIDYKAYAKSLAKIDYNWGDNQYQCLAKLWGKESAWNPQADNPNSSAFGIAQMINEDSSDGFVQISNGLRYINHRYANPCDAWQFWQRNNWY
jgi:hypothetical protein